MRLVVTTLLLAPLCAPASVLDAMSAHPDAPASEAGWRGSLRAKLGARIPLLDPAQGEPGWLLDVPAFVELHNTPGTVSLVPYELWRARVSIGAGYRWQWAPWAASLKLAAEHESDHATSPNQEYEFYVAPTAGFVALNSLALTAVAQQRGRHPLAVELTNRFHLLTCTASTTACGRTNGHGGDQTWELSAAATQRLALDEASTWVAFASVAGDVLVPTPNIAPATRFSTKVGIGLHHGPDWWTLGLTLLAGKDTGYYRQLDVLLFGLCLAWSPFT